MVTKPAEAESQRDGLVMQALGNQYGMLQSARGATISESSSRSSLYLTSLTGAVVGLSFVAQASRSTDTYFIFALAILPVVFFLGTATYYRLLQTGVEDVTYARSMSKIQEFFSEIDPARAELFSASSADQVGLTRLGMFGLRWQQFFFVAGLSSLPAIAVGAIATLLIAVAFLRHQWTTWMRVAKALPIKA